MRIYHIVLIKFKPGKTHRMAELAADLAKLRKVLPGFLSCTGGPYASPEGLNDGYTHGFVMTFVDAATRDRYLTHPDHEKIKAEHIPDLAGVIAFDFEGE
ncbi:MAG: Dabb family protein [Planctomycetes bacterium]|nr:Dabb family protein [Planctomycetota bacterium]